ncbi:MAG: hypothetical protein M3Q65_04475 [Chloroflexota bacterium]|nr:hypothetical protein [Chloroflexota bacterium]
MRALLWAVMMLIWLAGLLYGVWWVWPHFARMRLTTDLVASIIWLGAGTAAWLVAFNLGRQRYWRR